MLNDFKDRLFAKAEEAGFTDYEIYYVSGENFKVTIYEKEIDQYNVNSFKGLSFRGLYNDKMGYSYTEILDDYALGMLIENAKENAMAIEDEDTDIIYGDKDDYADFEGYNEELSKVDVEEKINLALELEREIEGQSEKIKAVDDCIVASGEGEKRIINSKGLDLRYKSNIIYAIISPIVEDKGQVNTAFAFKAANSMKEIDTKALAKKAVEDALAYIGSETIPSGKYKAVIRNDVMGDILSTFAGIFSAYNVQKGLSLLKDKVGTDIASDIVTIIDDPLLEGGLCSQPFDDEGVACYRNTIVDKGKLKTLLYNLKTAKKDGVKSTGNASKASYASTIGISPSNFFIKPGEKTREELIKNLGDGIFITEVQGLHAGANAVSGDFSLSAKGFEIKSGEIIKPIDQITVAGNFYKMLLDIVELGSDLKFGIPSGGCYGCPSVLVKELSIAGK